MIKSVSAHVVQAFVAISHASSFSRMSGQLVILKDMQLASLAQPNI